LLFLSLLAQSCFFALFLLGSGFRQLGQGLLHQVGGIYIIHQLAIVVGIICRQVEVAVAAQGY
jgi:hypothetical protein